MATEPVALDLAGYRPAVLADQPQPDLIWVDLADLVVDRTYQRSMTYAGRRAVQRIADGFDWRKYEPILIAPAADGKFAVVDGQHRAHAAGVCGIRSIPAMCVAMTIVQQAQGFTAINRDRIKVRAEQIYRAELAAGAPWALECKAAVNAAGCVLATGNASTAQKKPRTVFSVNLIRRMVAAGEASAVTAGLAGIAGSQQAEAIESYGGPVLAIWLPAVARNQRFLRLDLSAAFDGIDIDAVVDQARLRVRHAGGSARPLAIDAVAAHLDAVLRRVLAA